MPPNDQNLHFDVHPSVVFQLGGDLITDEVQALIEIVKNCYDAGASYAKVDIQTTAECGDAYPKSFYPKDTGYIAVTDDGEGMDIATLRSGWLVVSNSAKRQLKSSGNVPRNQRTPLGDKGLGRLASQRLGRNVEVFTTAKGSKVEQHIGFSWDAFHGHQALTQVPIEGLVETKSTRRSGTTVLISGLSQPEHWERPDRAPSGKSFKAYFEERLAELISPFEGIDGFTVTVSINGTQLDLARVPRQLRQEADVTFSFDFDGKQLRVAGRVKLRALAPTGQRTEVFSCHCERDSGQQLLKYLMANRRATDYRIKASRSSAWFVEVAMVDTLANQPGVLEEEVESPEPSDAETSQPTESERPNPVNPGSFRGEIDGFSLAAQRAEQQQAFTSAKAYKEFVKGIAGVYVYRDGFGIRVDRDFLELGRYWTTGGSWYGLKPANTMGYVALTARDNASLEETTDREGFKDNKHYRNFRMLLRRFVRFAADALEFLRRETIAFCDARLQEEAHVESGIGPNALTERIGQELKSASELGTRAESMRHSLSTAAKTVSAVASNVESSLFATTKEHKQATESLREISAAVEEGERMLAEATSILASIGDLQTRFHVLQAHVGRFEERLCQAYEMIGVGLTAEVLAHEIRHIADGLDQRTAAIMSYLKTSDLSDGKVAAYTRHVKSAVAALRKQLGHLDPSLKYVRHQREPIELDSFLNELRDHHQTRWRGQPLSIRINHLDKRKFLVHVNRGKLTQIFDNLILNSEYWLKEDIRLHKLEEGKVLIELRAPHVWLSDNGRGIDASVENSLFEPFVTLKESGRGLGLFVVREFLESEGCDIELFPERNADGRLYAFQLDLSGMIHGEETN